MTEFDDVAERGRAIFQRLRQDEPSASPTSPQVPEPGSDHDEAAPADGVEPSVVPAGDDHPAPDEISAHAVGADTAAEASDTPDLVDGAGPPAVAPAGPGRAPLPGGADLPPLDTMTGPDTELAATSSAEEAGAAAVGPAEADAPPAAEDPSAAGEAPAPVPPVSHFARPLPRVMAVANQKGGVGKTTTAVNLGACLADIGYRVLVVDLDPQGNASTGLGINIRDLQGSMYDVILHDLPIEDCVEATSVRNLFCAPSSLDLAGAEIELVPAFSRELRLKRALEEVHDDYDFVLIDCPPSLGLLTVNGLAAATEVIVPIQCEYYALEGLGQLLRNVNLVQRNLNPGLEVSAIILVMYDARTKLADQVVTEVRAHFGTKVCRNVVPRTVRLSEAPSFGQPIIAFDSSSRGAIAYRELAKEVSGGTPQRAR